MHDFSNKKLKELYPDLKFISHFIRKILDLLYAGHYCILIAERIKCFMVLLSFSLVAKCEGHFTTQNGIRDFRDFRNPKNSYQDFRISRQICQGFPDFEGFPRDFLRISKVFKGVKNNR